MVPGTDADYNPAHTAGSNDKPDLVGRLSFMLVFESLSGNQGMVRLVGLHFAAVMMLFL